MPLDATVVYGSPLVVRINLLIVIVLVALYRKALARAFSPSLTRSGVAAAAVITSITLWLGCMVVPHAPHVFWDEMKHLNIAQNMYRHGALAETVVGGLQDFTVLAPPTHWPAGFYNILSLVFHATGYSEAAAFQTNAVIAAMTVPLMFLLCLRLFEDQLTALMSAALLALWPVHLKYSGCADLTVSSLFWVIATALTFFIYRPSRENRLYVLFLSALSYAVNTRPENLILLPLFASFLPFHRKAESDLRWRRMVHALFAVSITPVLLLIFHNRLNEASDFGTLLPSAATDLNDNAADNLAAILQTLVRQWPLALCFSYGILKNPKESQESRKLFLCWMAAFLFIFSFHTYGYLRPASIERYSLVLFVPLVLYAAHGIRRLGQRLPRKALRAPAALAMTALCLIWAWRSDAGIFAMDESEKQRFDFLRASAGLLPKEVYVISYSAPMVNAMLDRPSVSANFFLEHKSDFERTIAEQGHSRDLILFKDFWWHQRRATSDRLERLLKKDYSFRPLAERKFESLTLGFYYLEHR